MANEEKIKAFFSSEQNIKKVIDNEEFMNRISDGTADAETYQSEFKKLGLELSPDDAKVFQETVARIMEKPIEELDEGNLKDVVGGVSKGKAVAGAVLGASVAAVV